MKNRTTYEIGTLILYDWKGVCRVERIGTVPFQKDDGRCYYELCAVFSNSNEYIYIPIDTALFMRPLISREEAEEYLDLFPSLAPKPFSGRTSGELTAHYQEMLAACGIKDCLLLIKEVHAKREGLAQRKKKLGQADVQYLRIAERLVCEEFAAVLQATPAAIRDRLYAAMQSAY